MFTGFILNTEFVHFLFTISKKLLDHGSFILSESPFIKKNKFGIYKKLNHPYFNLHHRKLF